MRIAAFLSITLLPSAVFSEQFSVAGNVEVMRLCLSADKYLSSLVDATYIIYESIGSLSIEDVRGRLIAEIDSDGLAEDFHLFSFVAGPNTLSRVGGDGIVFRQVAFDLIECVSYACRDKDSAFEAMDKAKEIKDQLWVACTQDFRGQK